MVVARGCSGAMTVGILTVHSHYERGHQSGRGNCGEGNEICGAVGKASFQSHAQTPVTPIPMKPPATASSTLKMSRGGAAADAPQQPRAPQDCSLAKHPPAAVTGNWHPAAQEPATTPAGPKPQQQSAAKKTGTRIGPVTTPTSVPTVTVHSPHAMSGSCEQMADGCAESKLCVALSAAWKRATSSRSCGIASTRELDTKTKEVNARATSMSTVLQRSSWPPDATGGPSLSNRV